MDGWLMAGKMRSKPAFWDCSEQTKNVKIETKNCYLVG